MKKVTCSKCGGAGYINNFKHVEDGICFECYGSGWIEIDEEKEQIKETKRTNKQFLKTKELRGFKNTDILYIVAEENTILIKEQLKNNGAIWNYYFRAWTFENDKLRDKYNLQAVKYEECENIKINKIKVNRTIKTELREINNNNTSSVDEALNDFFNSLE